jgi:hypothetical protein
MNRQARGGARRGTSGMKINQIRFGSYPRCEIGRFGESRSRETRSNVGRLGLCLHCPASDRKAAAAVKKLIEIGVLDMGEAVCSAASPLLVAGL